MRKQPDGIPTIGGTPLKEGYLDRLKSAWPPSAAREQLRDEICISRGRGSSEIETNVYLLASNPYNGRCKVGMAKNGVKITRDLSRSSGLPFQSLAQILCCCEKHAGIVKRELCRALQVTLEVGQREWFVLSPEELDHVSSVVSKAASIPRRKAIVDGCLVPDVEWLRSVKIIFGSVEL
jgi:hypothetical protein